jgi:hypothetical protein
MDWLCEKVFVPLGPSASQWETGFLNLAANELLARGIGTEKHSPVKTIVEGFTILSIFSMNILGSLIFYLQQWLQRFSWFLLFWLHQ